MKHFLFIKTLCEYLEGFGDEPPVRVPAWLAACLWGVWWVVLAVLIVLFCGQTSKFLYIDF